MNRAAVPDARLLLVVVLGIVVAAVFLSSFRVVVAVSDSMAPAFQRGDLLLVEKQAGVAVGDIVAYRSGEVPVMVVHRVIAVNASAVETQGDNNVGQATYERYVPRDTVIGEVAVVVPDVGRPWLWTRCWLGGQAVDQYC